MKLDRKYADSAVALATLPKLAQEIRRLRRVKNLSQTELADLVECSQGAISRYENGDMTALSEKTVRRICAELKIDVERSEQFVALPVQRIVCCTSATCPRNVPFLLEGRIVIRPAMAKIESDKDVFCSGCGVLMLDKCPDPRCQSPIVLGATFCQHCGTALVTVPKHLLDLADPKEFIRFQWEQQDRLNRTEFTAHADVPQHRPQET